MTGLEQTLAQILRGDLGTIWPGARHRAERIEHGRAQRRLPAGAVAAPVLVAALRQLAPEYLDPRRKTMHRISNSTQYELACLGWHECNGLWREPCYIRHDAPTPEGYTRREQWGRGRDEPKMWIPIPVKRSNNPAPPRVPWGTRSASGRYPKHRKKAGNPPDLG